MVDQQELQRELGKYKERFYDAITADIVSLKREIKELDIRLSEVTRRVDELSGRWKVLAAFVAATPVVMGLLIQLLSSYFGMRD